MQHPYPGAALACIWAGLVGLPVLACVRLVVPSFRRMVRGEPRDLAALCIVLLALQCLQTYSHCHGLGLLSPSHSSVLWHWPEAPKPHYLIAWVSVQMLACLCLSRLWWMRAYEVALSSGPYWVWSVSYFLVSLWTFGHHWGATFWGRAWES